MLRQPIITFMGNVDAGKTTLLDFIRKTAVAKSEPGLITQSISSTNLAIDVIKKLCGNLIQFEKIKIPGLLVIDTPGHAAFNNLRKRGGNLADIAVLVVDVNEGVMPQTVECIEILKNYKTPFVVALNKVDLISGWHASKDSLIKNIDSQSDYTKEILNKKLYEVLGKLAELKIDSERFDRVSDYTKQITIVPCSAKTGEGIPEVLMVLTGLAQKFLEKSLNIEVKGPAKGVVLEVKREKGMGLILDAIIYDGTLKKEDKIIIGGLDKPVITKIKALFEPEKKKLMPVKEVHAAIGVKISALAIESVISGMPFKVIENLEKDKKEVQESIEEVLIETDKSGVIVKADSLGSLEAVTGMLKDKKIPIKIAAIGNITKEDIAEAKSEKDPLLQVILGFNVKGTGNVKIITNNVIYQIIEDYEKWRSETEKTLEARALEKLTYPFKVQILPGCVFRQSNPAVVGVAIISGKVKTDVGLMKANGVIVSEVKSMQSEGETINEAKKGQEVAIAIPHIIVGRQIKENDILYSNIPEEDFLKIKKMKRYLNKDEIEVLKEIAEIKRKKNPMWGV